MIHTTFFEQHVADTNSHASSGRDKTRNQTCPPVLQKRAIEGYLPCEYSLSGWWGQRESPGWDEVALENVDPSQEKPDPSCRWGKGRAGGTCLVRVVSGGS